MFTLSELRLYRHAQDHRLLTRDILPGWIIPVYLVISLVTPDIKSYLVFRWTLEVEVQRGVTRPATTARQPGAEMNETDGMSIYEGMSQDNSVSNYYPDLSLVIQVWQSYPNYPRNRWDM